MGKMSKSTFKKLTLLYFIGKFKNGVYSSYRVQKVFYFGTENSDIRPFAFTHTEHGQYSRAIKDDLNSLVAIGLIEKTGLEKTEDNGVRWSISTNITENRLTEILPRINSRLALSLDKSVDEFGYLKREDLKSRAHEDILLAKTEIGHLIFNENLPDNIEVKLSDDECEDLELSLNEQFVVGMDHIVSAIETTDFDMGKVRKVATIF